LTERISPTEGLPLVDRETFRHEALLYAGEDEFVSTASAFLRAGIEAEEPALVVVSSRKIDRLREALGRDASRVTFADMSDVGANPARIIPVWHGFVAQHGSPGTRLRGIGEPIYPSRSADELVESQRHEALLNLAFADARAFWLLCPYDTTALDPAVIAEAFRSHPHVSGGGSADAGSHYHGLEAIAGPFRAPLPEPPADAATFAFSDESELAAVRRFLVSELAQSGISTERRGDLLIVVNEIASNSLRHGGGRGELAVWRTDGRVVCEIRDEGQFADPLADRRPPNDERPGGRGLWLANQLCDLVQVRSFDSGTVVRLHLAV
jgi:anti-sigma regulatory factor (Ser/Thr protein kinase)